MAKDGAKQVAKQLLKKAGIKVNGSNPWDIKVHNEEFYKRVLAEGSLGLGESYMDGWWDVKRLDLFFVKVFEAKLNNEIVSAKMVYEYIKANIVNRQTKRRAKKVAKEHYDLGNDLYSLMLGKHMQYSCGYWKKAKTLDEAQKNKMDLICKKLGLKKGMTVLDIGGGFGTLTRHMAKKYGCKVTMYNISKEQVAYAKKINKGLPVKVVRSDYREAQGQFDRVVSVGFIEHVGYKNYKQLMKVVHRCLKEDGIALLHTIGGNKSVKGTEPWLNKYIFPRAVLPSIKQLSAAMEGLFVVEDWHNFGYDYSLTLDAWFKNFNKNWSKLKDNYNKKFYRMWKYYLLACKASFEARNNQLWQIVVSKKGVKKGYQRVS